MWGTVGAQDFGGGGLDGVLQRMPLEGVLRVRGYGVLVQRSVRSGRSHEVIAGAVRSLLHRCALSSVHDREWRKLSLDLRSLRGDPRASAVDLLMSEHGLPSGVFRVGEPYVGCSDPEVVHGVLVFVGNSRLKLLSHRGLVSVLEVAIGTPMFLDRPRVKDDVGLVSVAEVCPAAPECPPKVRKWSDVVRGERIGGGGGGGGGGVSGSCSRCGQELPRRTVDYPDLVKDAPGDVTSTVEEMLVFLAYVWVHAQDSLRVMKCVQAVQAIVDFASTKQSVLDSRQWGWNDVSLCPCGCDEHARRTEVLTKEGMVQAPSLVVDLLNSLACVARAPRVSPCLPTSDGGDGGDKDWPPCITKMMDLAQMREVFAKGGSVTDVRQLQVAFVLPVDAAEESGRADGACASKGEVTLRLAGVVLGGVTPGLGFHGDWYAYPRSPAQEKHEKRCVSTRCPHLGGPVVAVPSVTSVPSVPVPSGSGLVMGIHHFFPLTRMRGRAGRAGAGCREKSWGGRRTKSGLTGLTGLTGKTSDVVSLETSSSPAHFIKLMAHWDIGDRVATLGCVHSLLELCLGVAVTFQVAEVK